MKDSFVFYRSFKESLSDLSNDDKLIMYEAISDYALDRIEPNLQGFPRALFKLVRPQLDANWRRFENGRKGGAPSGNKNAVKEETTKKQPRNNLETTKKQAKTTWKQPNVNDNVNVNDNDNDNENENKKDIDKSISKKNSKKFFSPPNLEEVKEYCSERQNKVDAEKFINFYEAKGWMVGKNKMKDWKAAIRTWEKTSPNNSSYKPYVHPMVSYKQDLNIDDRW